MRPCAWRCLDSWQARGQGDSKHCESICVRIRNAHYVCKYVYDFLSYFQLIDCLNLAEISKFCAPICQLCIIMEILWWKCFTGFEGFTLRKIYSWCKQHLSTHSILKSDAILWISEGESILERWEWCLPTVVCPVSCIAIIILPMHTFLINFRSQGIEVIPYSLESSH